MLVLVLWSLDKYKRKRFFPITYGVAVCCVLVFFSISSSFGRQRYCQNNTNVVDGRSGVGVCTAEGAMLVFAIQMCGACFCMQSFNVFRRLVMKSRAPFRPMVSIFIVLVIPLGCSLTLLFAGAYGSSFGTDICTGRGGGGALPMLMGTVPVVIFTLFGMIFSGTLVVQTLFLAVSGQSLWDAVRLVSTPLHFLVFSGLYLGTMLYVRFTVFDGDEILLRQEVMTEWGVCALLHFDGSYESYVPSCGSMPPRDTSIAQWCITAFVLRGGFGCVFFVVNIGGVVTELRKYICPSSVKPVYIELAPVSLDTSNVNAADMNNVRQPTANSCVSDTEGCYITPAQLMLREGNIFGMNIENC